MERCDVLVVGGGPAGSTVAWKLRLAGFDVLVLDKQEFPRNKVCAGWITPAVLEELRLDREEYGRRNVLQPISAFRSGLIDGSTIHTDYGDTVSYGIRRYEFDDYLLRRSGARLALGEPLSSLERQEGRWLVNGRIETPLVVGAGGHFCPVARTLGAQLGRSEPTVKAQEVEFEMTGSVVDCCPVRGDTPELYFCPDLKGYGWIFRKGAYLNVGLGREESDQIAHHVSGFCEFLTRLGRLPEGVSSRFQGHAYLLYGQPSPRAVVADGLMLAGDAAGLAYPQSGEGIRPAVESALLAAETIIEAEGVYTPDRLRHYEERLEARFGPRRTSGNFDLPETLKQALAKPLMASRLFTRHVLLDRWFLRREQERLQSLAG